MPTLAPYTPALYLPRNLGRYRSYPRTVVTPIPGAGYRVRRLVWGDQPLNLRGAQPGVPPRTYGLYDREPLLGLGDDIQPQQVLNIADITSRIITSPDATLRQYGPAIVTGLDKYVLGPVIDKAAQRSAPYLLKYVMPPVAVLYLLTGLATFYSYQALKAVAGKRGVQANRRRRHRRAA